MLPFITAYQRITALQRATVEQQQQQQQQQQQESFGESPPLQQQQLTPPEAGAEGAAVRSDEDVERESGLLEAEDRPLYSN